MVPVEDLHEWQVVILLVRESDDEEDVLVFVELVVQGCRQVGLKNKKSNALFILFLTIKSSEISIKTN